MEITETDIEGVFVIEPAIHADGRGYFYESYNKAEFDKKVCPVDFVQDNQSKSSYGVLRGLHYQKGSHAQAKLVRVVSGLVLDVAVDIREGSPTYGRYVTAELSGENMRQFFIPRGFAHGFAVLSREAVFQYKCDNYYAPQAEAGIAYDDPDIGIDWKIPLQDIILSEKDRRHPRLRDAADSGCEYEKTQKLQ
ncbi:MAG: dTDP-4-dehydrorhamnose 3,5-epimerase [Flavobacteriales bacterium]|nr:dTDP-4-dehydrorhamnose 3,5-epimerase [Flavobacteriales bacterium]